MLYAPHFLALALVPVRRSGSGQRANFSDRIEPVFARNGAKCPGGHNPAWDLSVDGLDSLLPGGGHGPAIRPGGASEGLLTGYLRGQHAPEMPLGGEMPDLPGVIPGR